MEIAPGVYQLKVPIPENPLGHVNCYLVEGKGGWLLVDTGWYTVEALKSLEGGLQAMGLAVADISTMVVTHVHPDHFGLAGRIKQISPRTELLLHSWESALIESRYIKFRQLQAEMTAMLERHGVPALDVSRLGSASTPALPFVTVTLPDRLLYGGETISTGIHNLEVIWTPGHSPGHVCLYEPRSRLLFAGDHVLPSITPNVSYHVQSGDNPLGDYVYALRKIENLPVTKVLPAHEQVFDDLRGRVEQILDHHDRRKAEIQEVIAREPHNAYEIASKISWNIPGLAWEQFPPLHQRVAVTEVVAHLECMRWEGKVQRLAEGNSIAYRTT